MKKTTAFLDEFIIEKEHFIICTAYNKKDHQITEISLLTFMTWNKNMPVKLTIRFNMETIDNKINTQVFLDDEKVEKVIEDDYVSIPIDDDSIIDMIYRLFKLNKDVINLKTIMLALANTIKYRNDEHCTEYSEMMSKSQIRDAIKFNCTENAKSKIQNMYADIPVPENDSPFRIFAFSIDDYIKFANELETNNMITSEEKTNLIKRIKGDIFKITPIYYELEDKEKRIISISNKPMMTIMFGPETRPTKADWDDFMTVIDDLQGNSCIECGFYVKENTTDTEIQKTLREHYFEPRPLNLLEEDYIRQNMC